MSPKPSSCAAWTARRSFAACRPRRKFLTIHCVNGQPFKLSNTILYCSRWPETVDFYRRVLGLPVNAEKDWFVEFRLTAHSFVSIANAERATIDSSAGQGITLTLQVEDIDEIHSRLAEAGAEIGSVKRHPWGSVGFFCRDPEGYRLEFWQPLGD